MDKINRDFITIWSKFLLTNYYGAIKDDLEQLAQDGNVDAISAWYGFNGIGQNKQIDKNAQSLLATNYKTSRAIACYFRRSEEKNIININNKIQALLNYNAKNISTLGCIVKKDIMARFEQNLDEVEHLQDLLLKTKYVEYTLVAIKQAKEAYGDNGDIVALSVMGELLEKLAQELPFINEAKKWKKQAKKCRDTIIKKLLKKYQNDGNFFNDEQAFIVAKTLIKCKNKEAITLGKIILNSLSNKPFAFYTFKDKEM